MKPKEKQNKKRRQVHICIVQKVITARQVTNTFLIISIWKEATWIEYSENNIVKCFVN
jgi:hypothetical protein